MDNLNPQKLIPGAIILALAVGIAYFGKARVTTNSPDSQSSPKKSSASKFNRTKSAETSKTQSSDSNTSTKSLKPDILIEVSGAVNYPGLYKMPHDSRMLDLIQACGGVSETADLNKINRAAILKDGEKIEVPSLPSAKKTSASNPTPQSQQNPKNSPPKQSSKSTNYQSSTPIPSQTNGQQTEQLTSNQPTPISINTATQAMIETLPGVGPSLAKRIVDYREGIGGFNSINELSQVRGVGPSLLEKIRPFITL